MKGYMAKLLRVNLTTRQVSEEPLDPKLARDYIGGMGLGGRLAYDEIPPDTDPLGPDAKILFMTGPVTGTVLGTAGRFQVVFKSPLTGILCDSSCGGHWGAEFKKAGYDGLIVEGATDAPVYVYINDGKTEIREASHVWGKGSFETHDALLEEVSEPKARVLSIGLAGERGVLYACMIDDQGRTPGRGGTGAVMGSKNLKAIVVRGTRQIELADPEAFKAVAVGLNKHTATTPGIAGIRNYGTSTGMNAFWPVGNIPVKNWQLGSYEDIATKLGGERLNETITRRDPGTCHNCAIICSRWVDIEEGPYKMSGPGPEYESLGALGTMCLVDDAEAVAYANHLCNMYGIDTISCGATIAFAMECYEKGLITKGDTGGIELTWGDKDVLVEMVNKIAHREGVGEMLAQGTRKMAEQLGGDSMDFAVHVKGLEAPMHDPRARFAWGATYATSSRGACHLHGNTGIYEDKEDPVPEWEFLGKYPRHSNQGKGKMARFAQNWSATISSMAICYFAAHTFVPSDLAALINHATGFGLTPKDLLVFGDRINALYRAYNYRCGIRREDDNLPLRLLTPVAEGGAAGKVPDIEYQLKEYYEVRRWEPDGKPSYDSLVELGLEDVAHDLYA